MLTRTVVYELDYDAVWLRANRWFAAHSVDVQIDAADKASGWIAASNLAEVSPDVLDIGKITATGPIAKGPIIEQLLVVDVLIRGLGDQTEATINVAGYFDAKAWSSLGLMSFTIRRAGRSTGALEQSFHSSLAGQ